MSIRPSGTWPGAARGASWGPGAPAEKGGGADYDPSGNRDERRSAVERLRASLGTAEVPPPGSLTAPRGRAGDRDLEIGE